MSLGLYAGDLTPLEAWKMLKHRSSTRLIDVRTPPEWAYVGQPVLLGSPPLFISWRDYPALELNDHFAAQVRSLCDETAPLILLCRSGKRSKEAAIFLSELAFKRVYNVQHGFEGDKDSSGQRGLLNGWRRAGLPWRQG